MLDHKAIGSRIRLTRLSLDLNQEDLAELVGISASFIGAIERTEKSATIDTFDSICEALGVSWDYLMKGTVNRCDQQNCPLFKDAVELLQRYGMDVSSASAE